MEPASIVLFGATGDLAKRKIYPALYNLFIDGKLPRAFSVIGLGRREWSDQDLRDSVTQSLAQFSRRKADDAGKLEQFLQAFRYFVLDIGREDDYNRLKSLVEDRERELGLVPNRLFYLSVGPEHFETIADNIRSSGLGSASGWKRLVIEKPFGHDLRSARELNDKLTRSFAEDEIYRIDHYLGKQVLQQWKALQQSNPFIQALWTNRYIANVQITASESVGIGERAGYYDHIGALRDMFQNHMLQLLMMTAVQFSSDNSPDDVRFKKRCVMEALDLLQQEQIGNKLIRGQYTAGAIDGKPAIGYTSEQGVPEQSRTETFVAARLHIDNQAWRGVPFYIRTGKRMQEKSTRIVIEFKESVRSNRAERYAPNLLIIEIGPEENITLRFNGADGGSQPSSLELYTSPANSPEAYEHLICDALKGDATYFAHWNEVELSWQWVQPALDAFRDESVPLYHYEAGTYGPAEADAMLAQDGYHWWLDDRSAQNTTEEEGIRHASYAHA